MAWRDGLVTDLPVAAPSTVDVEARPRQAFAASPGPLLRVRWLGCVPYCEAVQAMQGLVRDRRVEQPDELWLLEHPPVFTLGQAGRRSHVREAGPIPVVRSDRGGQVTYHGPGQLVAYLLLDLHRARLGVRRLVETLEQAVIHMLGRAHVAAVRRDSAPGVYVEGRKVASVGLRVRAGCTLHGISVNVDLDLSPFDRIDTCGMTALPVTRLADLGIRWNVEETGRHFAASLGRTYARNAECCETRSSSVHGSASRSALHVSGLIVDRTFDSCL